MWKLQVESLAPMANCIALDIRGHGNSTTGHGFFSIDVFAKDILAFIRKLKLDNVILCGISMGGYIALRAYEVNPEPFKALILCDTHAFEDDKEGKQKRFDTIQSVLNHGRRPFAIGFVDKLFTAHSIENNIPEIDLIKSSVRRNTISTICSTLLALASRTDTSDNLANISVPTLLIRGEEDKITSRKSMEYMHSHIPNVTFVEIDEAGHLPNLENPETFNHEVSKFLIQLDT